MKHSRDAADVVPYEREADRPAPTVDAKAVGAWCWERPSTAIMGDPRIAPPGYRKGTDSPSNIDGESVRVELHELAKLQDFPDGYPFQGTRTQRARQIGNAVPSTLAEVIVRSLGA